VARSTEEPAIAYHVGSVLAVIQEGVTGFIEDGLEDTMRTADRL
jgi:hypothetical protein